MESAGHGRPTAAEAGRQTSNGSLAADMLPLVRFSARSNVMNQRRRGFSGGALHRIGAAAISEFRADRDSVPVLQPEFHHTLPNGTAFEATSVDAGIPDLWRVRCPGCHAGSDGRSERTEAATERAAGDKKADGGLSDLANDGPHGSMRNNARFGYGRLASTHTVGARVAPEPDCGQRWPQRIALPKCRTGVPALAKRETIAGTSEEFGS